MNDERLQRLAHAVQVGAWFGVYPWCLYGDFDFVFGSEVGIGSWKA